MNNICHICGRDIVSPVDPVCDCAEELESLRSANQAMTETAAENSRVHVELHNRTNDLLNDLRAKETIEAKLLQKITDLTDARNELKSALDALNEENAQLSHQLWCIENPE